MPFPTGSSAFGKGYDTDTNISALRPQCLLQLSRLFVFDHLQSGIHRFDQATGGDSRARDTSIWHVLLANEVAPPNLSRIYSDTLGQEIEAPLYCEGPDGVAEATICSGGTLVRYEALDRKAKVLDAEP
jgi:hypothetical protein